MVEIKVTLYYNDDNGSTWHCGSLDGAKKFIDSKIAKGGVSGYCIEAIEWLPVDANEPDGLLYGGMKYFDYKEVANG